MSVEPDDKDWTWVIDRPCQECGYESRDLDVRRAGSVIRANAAVWSRALASPRCAERFRPDRWSVLEYAGHVRDVHRVYLGRLRRMLDEDGPEYENWDQDRTAVEQRYGEADPTAVAVELEASAQALASAFDAIPDDAWGRTGSRSDGARFTVDSFTRYLVHDLDHHLWDIGEPRLVTDRPEAP